MASALRKLVFIGFMGAGKSTAAATAAKVQKTDATDVDEVIEERLGKPIAQVFAQDGERAFREMEEQVTLELLADPDRRVLSLGGGAVGSETVRHALREQLVIWIDVPVHTAWTRASGTGRPLASDRATFERLHAEREPIYAQLADATVLGERPEAIDQVLAALEGVPECVKLLWAASTSSNYPAYVGDGVLTQHHFWPGQVEGRRYLVSDQTAEGLYADLLEPLTARISIPPGERSKSLDTAAHVWRELARAGATRADLVVALGGGVAGDLAGFCSATYQRGVRCVQVPTTLVAQVDSAYGGKTGIDLPEAKNYVGAYHQPAAVLTDTSTLKTLPQPELAAGYAEVLKTALIAGGWLWQRVREGADATSPEVIAACALTKLRVVAADERDGGLRAVLNLGHTVGHAIETVTGYERYRHGEAVALGLLAALTLSGQPDLREEVRELLSRHRLPTTLDHADPEAVVRATARDKKRVGEGPVPFVLLDAPGRPRAGCAVDAGTVAAAVQELRV